MMMLSAPSPGPPTLLRSTAGFSRLIGPSPLPVSDAAAPCEPDAEAEAEAVAAGPCDAVLAEGEAVPPVHAARTTASDAVAAESDRAFMNLLLRALPQSESCGGGSR